MVDDGDLVMDQVRIGLVEMDALLEHGLVVEMQRKAGGIIGTRALEAARLDFEHVVTAVTVLVYPATDRITLIARFDFVRPIASVGENAAIVVHISDQYVCRVRRDDELERTERDHHVRHARGNAAGVAGIVALATLGL